MVTIRWQNFKETGEKITFEWTFEPLNDRPGLFHIRDEGKDASGIPLRNPYFEQDIRTIKLSAGMLAIPDCKKAFRSLVRAFEGRVWFEEEDDHGKKTWRSFIADFPDEITYEFFEDRDPLQRYEIKFIEEEARDFTTWIDANEEIVVHKMTITFTSSTGAH